MNEQVKWIYLASLVLRFYQRFWSFLHFDQTLVGFLPQSGWRAFGGLGALMTKITSFMLFRFHVFNIKCASYKIMDFPHKSALWKEA